MTWWKESVLQSSERADGSDPDWGGEVLRSQVAFAVLGLVIEEPSYGYAIWRRFRFRFGGFIPGSKSMIYWALGSLTKAGLVEKMSGVEPTGWSQGAKPGDSYRATRQGAQLFRTSAAERLRSDPQRAEMLGGLVMAGMGGIESAIEFIDRYDEQCLQDLQAMAPPAPDGSRQATSGVSSLVEQLIFEERRRRIDAQLKWADYARAQLCALEERAKDDPREDGHAR